MIARLYGRGRMNVRLYRHITVWLKNCYDRICCLKYLPNDGGEEFYTVEEVSVAIDQRRQLRVVVAVVDNHASPSKVLTKTSTR